MSLCGRKVCYGSANGEEEEVLCGTQSICLAMGMAVHPAGKRDLQASGRSRQARRHRAGRSRSTLHVTASGRCRSAAQRAFQQGSGASCLLSALSPCNFNPRDWLTHPHPPLLSAGLRLHPPAHPHHKCHSSPWRASCTVHHCWQVFPSLSPGASRSAGSIRHLSFTPDTTATTPQHSTHHIRHALRHPEHACPSSLTFLHQRSVRRDRVIFTCCCCHGGR